jgi:hypothetical protein
MAPCMLGTFRRAFAFGHIRQLDRVAEMVMAGRGRRARHHPMTLEVDATSGRSTLTTRAAPPPAPPPQLGDHPGSRPTPVRCWLPVSAPGGGPVVLAPNGSSTSWPVGPRCRCDRPGHAAGRLGVLSAKVLAARRRHLRFSITVPRQDHPRRRPTDPAPHPPGRPQARSGRTGATTPWPPTASQQDRAGHRPPPSRGR